MPSFLRGKKNLYVPVIWLVKGYLFLVSSYESMRNTLPLSLREFELELNSVPFSITNEVDFENLVIQAGTLRGILK